MSFLDFIMGVFLGLVVGVFTTALYMTKPQVVVSYMNDEIIQCNMKVQKLKFDLTTHQSWLVKCEMHP